MNKKTIVNIGVGVVGGVWSRTILSRFLIFGPSLSQNLILVLIQSIYNFLRSNKYFAKATNFEPGFIVKMEMMLLDHCSIRMKFNIPLPIILPHMILYAALYADYEKVITIDASSKCRYFSL